MATNESVVIAWKRGQYAVNTRATLQSNGDDLYSEGVHIGRTIDGKKVGLRVYSVKASHTQLLQSYADVMVNSGFSGGWPNMETIRTRIASANSPSVFGRSLFSPQKWLVNGQEFTRYEEVSRTVEKIAREALNAGDGFTWLLGVVGAENTFKVSEPLTVGKILHNDGRETFVIVERVQ